MEGWRAAEGAERFLIVSTGDTTPSRHSSAVSPAPKFSPGGSAFAGNWNPSRKKFERNTRKRRITSWGKYTLAKYTRYA